MGGEYPAGIRDVQKDRVPLGFGNLYASAGDQSDWVESGHATQSDWSLLDYSPYNPPVSHGAEN